MATINRTPLKLSLYINVLYVTNGIGARTEEGVKDQVEANSAKVKRK